MNTETSHEVGRTRKAAFAACSLGALIAASLVWVAPVGAQVAPDGCDRVDAGEMDGFFSETSFGPSAWQAGETITATAGAPISGVAANFYISVDGTGQVAAGTIPGTISYTFPADTTINVRVGVFEAGAATFSVTCGGVPVSTTTPTTSAPTTAVPTTPVPTTTAAVAVAAATAPAFTG